MARWSSEHATHQGRLRAVTVGRVVTALLLAALLATVLRDLTDPAGRPLLAWAFGLHLLVQLGALLLTRRRTEPRSSVEVTLLADVGALAVVIAVTGGLASPLAALLLTEAVAVTLLFGRWAGARASILGSLAIAWVFTTGPSALDVAATTARRADLSTGIALEPPVRALLLLLVLWITTLATGWVADVIERDLRRRTEDLTLLREVTPDLDPRQGTIAVAEALAEVLVDRLGHPASAIWLVDGGQLELTAESGTRQHPSIEPADRSLDLEDDLVLRTLAADTVHPIRGTDPRPEPLVALFGDRAPLAVVPLGLDDGIVGLFVVEVTSRLGRRPTLRIRELRLLQMLAEQASLLLENARLQTELADQAITDAVTGLPNHRYLQQRLGAELERLSRDEDRGDRRPLSVALLDLDHFKAVNDTYGHPTGDLVLAAVAEAAQRTLRGSDVVCRYGGEEFALILPETNESAAWLACERVRRAVRELRLTALDGRALPMVTASLGVATIAGAALDRATILARADEALYAAKNGGRDRVIHDADRTVPLP
ncbi:MAG: sensor domain-containing diguanylate cyclase [Nitriliruptor sp.]